MEILNNVKLSVRNLSKSFDGKLVLNDLSFDLREGEFLSILGPSGCGKTTLLRILIGLETADSGQILKGGQDISKLPSAQRGMGIVFQNYALFPNMTVLQNIRAGAKREKDRGKRDAMIETVLERFGLREYAGRYPHQLSGGQQQRVALGRMLVSDPQILLLDEPFSALDSHLRFKLEREVRQTMEQFGKTVILVSHDRDEVFRMSRKIAVMDNGRIQAIGTREQVFANPGTRRGAMLTGCKFVSGIEQLGDGRIFAQEWGITLEVPDLPPEITAIGIRMHDVRPGPGENCFRCKVVEEIENPFSYSLLLQPIGADCVSPLGWDVSKEMWKQHRAAEVEICLPVSALLLLRD